jgi:hypothetical protein
MSELVWLVTHGTQTTRERASAELDRRFPNAAAQPEPPGWRTIESAPTMLRVLVLHRGMHKIATLDDGLWFIDTHTTLWESPSHWMPLPEVPR